MAENKFTAVDAVPEVVLWPMWDEYSASGIYFKTGDMSEEEKNRAADRFCEIAAEKWKQTREWIPGNYFPEEYMEDEDYYAVGENPTMVNRCDILGDGFLVLLEPLMIYYCYGELAIGNEGEEALTDALKTFAGEFPDIKYCGQVNYNWSDRHCGETVSYLVEGGLEIPERWDFVGQALKEFLTNEPCSFFEHAQDYDREDLETCKSFFELYRGYVPEEVFSEIDDYIDRAED